MVIYGSHGVQFNDSFLFFFSGDKYLLIGIGNYESLASVLVFSVLLRPFDGG